MEKLAYLSAVLNGRFSLALLQEFLTAVGFSFSGSPTQIFWASWRDHSAPPVQGTASSIQAYFTSSSRSDLKAVLLAV
jgi:hypothetical protein